MRNIPKDSKIAIAMSGGVDSSVAAALLVEEGYDVRGVFMEHLEGVEEQKNSAQDTADKLGIALEVVDYREEFKNTVIDYFLDEYRKGRTPNPCVVCNKWIKFGKLLEYTKELGCDYLATGHYARLQREIINTIRRPADQITNKSDLIGEEAYGEKSHYSRHSGLNPESDGNARRILNQVQDDEQLNPGFEESAGRLKLIMAEDKSKDQSYFLWQLEQEHFEQVLFPIGVLNKVSVVKIAKEKSLPAVERPESFEVCFVRDSLEKFLRKNIPEAIEPGPVLNTKGEVVGKHEGLPLYTYGQRRGFEVTQYRGIPQYVVGIDRKRNALIVGRGEASEVGSFKIEETNWIGELVSFLDRQLDGEEEGPPQEKPRRLNPQKPSRLGNAAGAEGEFSCKVRVRHQGELMDCTVEFLEADEARVGLNQPACAVAPGQSAVFYRGEEVLGGGVISHLSG